uniref:Guanylate cyclase n=1 Tax=Heterorhabditis bacteriophora TaxID=37862 RepID=A0A1I7XCF5_HETBA
MEVKSTTIHQEQMDYRINNRYIISDLASVNPVTFPVILVCLDSSSDRRRFLITAYELGMTTDEYVFIFMAMRSFAFVPNGLTPMWEDLINHNADGMDEVAHEAAKRVLVIDLNSEVINPLYSQKFKSEVVERVRRDPLYCETPACLNNRNLPMGSFARHLHDVFYLYGTALNKSAATEEENGFRNATIMTEAMIGTFSGKILLCLTGEVTINEKGVRDPMYVLYALNTDGEQESLMNITYIEGSTVVDWFFRFLSICLLYIVRNRFQILEKLYVDESRTLWATRGGKRTRHQEQMKLNAEWQIPRSKMITPVKQMKYSHSYRSLQSGSSSSSGDTAFNSTYKVYIVDNELVLSKKCKFVLFTKSDRNNFVKLRKLEHENLDKFIGLSIEEVEYLAVWKMCERGSLQEIIGKGMFTIDPFFIFCLIRDVAEGNLTVDFKQESMHFKLKNVPAWNITNRNESIDGLQLVRDCWIQSPENRPSSDTICDLLQTMKPSQNSNLMDHVFNMLEDYTTTLELEVEERTKELSEEKKKADILLGKMLPIQVAERLKLGQTVEPEGFDSVTVFFSDVVKFTQLAAKCSPYQISKCSFTGSIFKNSKIHIL